MDAINAVNVVKTVTPVFSIKDTVKSQTTIKDTVKSQTVVIQLMGDK